MRRVEPSVKKLIRKLISAKMQHANRIVKSFIFSSYAPMSFALVLSDVRSPSSNRLFMQTVMSGLDLGKQKHLNPFMMTKAAAITSGESTAAKTNTSLYLYYTTSQANRIE